MSQFNLAIPSISVFITWATHTTWLMFINNKAPPRKFRNKDTRLIHCVKELGYLIYGADTVYISTTNRLNMMRYNYLIQF